MLFSEPKIPQFWSDSSAARTTSKFQCSSASRKFLNSCARSGLAGTMCRFSALQRAENSSIDDESSRRPRACEVSVLFSEPKIPQSHPCGRRTDAVRPVFQCSSASRKFLNFTAQIGIVIVGLVSVLFSEPKIPQL